MLIEKERATIYGQKLLLAFDSVSQDGMHNWRIHGSFWYCSCHRFWAAQIRKHSFGCNDFLVDVITPSTLFP